VKVPDQYIAEAIENAKEVIGEGYVREYYAQVAANFYWLYEQGFYDAKKEAAAKARKLARDTRKKGLAA